MIAGAAAAHLAGDPSTATLLTNGALYGMIHAAALLAIIGVAQGREPRRGAAAFAGWCFAVGIVLFDLRRFAHTRRAGFAGLPYVSLPVRWHGVYPRLDRRRNSCVPPALNV